MSRLSATDVSRNFSSVINRVAGGEVIEVVSNGESIAEMRPADPPTAISAALWRDLFASAPEVDDAFAEDVRAGRAEIGPPQPRWPS